MFADLNNEEDDDPEETEIDPVDEDDDDDLSTGGRLPLPDPSIDTSLVEAIPAKEPSWNAVPKKSALKKKGGSMCETPPPTSGPSFFTHLHPPAVSSPPPTLPKPVGLPCIPATFTSMEKRPLTVRQETQSTPRCRITIC